MPFLKKIEMERITSKTPIELYLIETLTKLLDFSEEATIFSLGYCC